MTDAIVVASSPSEPRPPIHALEFLDRAARPAIWHARCGMIAVPLHQTTSVPQNVTCSRCLAVAEPDATDAGWVRTVCGWVWSKG